MKYFLKKELGGKLIPIDESVKYLQKDDIIFHDKDLFIVQWKEMDFGTQNPECVICVTKGLT